MPPAGNARVQLILDAIDKVSAPIRRINRRIETMTAPVRKVKRAFGSLAREAKLDRLAAGVARLGKGMRRLVAGPMAGFVALAASFAGVGFAKQGIEAAAAYESLGVRLKVLTGNAEGARRVLEGVDKLATKTPFSLEELGNAAANLSVIFKGNTDRVSQFTAIAADLAAAYGRPVEQISENLQRAFSAGIGSADVLRESGITAEIFRITGATKPAEVSSRQLFEALQKLTAEGGPAFRAAAEQALTLEGSISNAKIAFGNFQRAVGEALAPLIGPFLNEVVIPRFERLQRLVRENAAVFRGGFSRAVESVQRIWSSLVSGLESGFSAMRGVGGAGGSLGESLSRLGVVVADLFEKFGGWETVGNIVGGIVGFMANQFSRLARVLAGLLEIFNELTPAFASAADFVSPAIETGASALSSVRESAFETVGSVLDSAQEFAGKIVVAIDDDGRLQARAAEASPGLEVGIEGGGVGTPI